jgi:hypothetical protein
MSSGRDWATSTTSSIGRCGVPTAPLARPHPLGAGDENATHGPGAPVDDMGSVFQVGRSTRATFRQVS